MPTPAPTSEVRSDLQLITAAAAAEILGELDASTPASLLDDLGPVLAALVPGHYDTAGELAAEWYENLRDASPAGGTFSPSIRGNAATDWIEREVTAYAKSFERGIADELAKMEAEVEALLQKEVARGFRETIIGNADDDREAIGFSRVARPGACPMCLMLAGKGAVYKTESTARFAAHGDCYCLARPAFRGGAHGPEASVEQYVAAKSRRTPEQQQALKEYLHEHYGAPKPRPLKDDGESAESLLAKGRAKNAPRLEALNDLLRGLGN